MPIGTSDVVYQHYCLLTSSTTSHFEHRTRRGSSFGFGSAIVQLSLLGCVVSCVSQVSARVEALLELDELLPAIRR